MEVLFSQEKWFCPHKNEIILIHYVVTLSDTGNQQYLHLPEF